MSSSAPIRRAASAAAVADTRVSFGNLSMYAGGGGIPEGDYILFFDVMMYQAENKQGVKRGPARLGVMLNAYPLLDPTEEAKKTKFYGMGRNMDKSFAPGPDGKSIVPVPGGPASTFPKFTNWDVLLRSFYDSGLGEGVFDNDLTVLDGMHAHIALVAAPEERKSFQKSKTGEAGEDEAEDIKGDGMIPIVTEIKEDGKPWEGTGGIPDAAAPKAAPKAPARPAPGARPSPVATRPAARPAPAAAPAEVVDLGDIATNGVTEVLLKNPNGCTKLLLRTATFKAVTVAVDEETANAVLETYFGTDDALNSILGPLGYVSAKGQITSAG